MVDHRNKVLDLEAHLAEEREKEREKELNKEAA